MKYKSKRKIQKKKNIRIKKISRRLPKRYVSIV